MPQNHDYQDDAVAARLKDDPQAEEKLKMLRALQSFEIMIPKGKKFHDLSDNAEFATRLRMFCRPSQHPARRKAPKPKILCGCLQGPTA